MEIAKRVLILAFILGLVTFIIEIAAIRLLGLFFGFGVKGTSLVILTFILGLGVGTIAYIKMQRHSAWVIVVFILSLILLANATKLLGYLVHNVAFAAYYLTLLLLFLTAGSIGYWYALKIDQAKKYVLKFLTSNLFGSFIGCLFPILLFPIVEIQVILSAISIVAIVYLFIEQKKVLITLAAIFLVVTILAVPDDPSRGILTANRILSEKHNVTFKFPLELHETGLGYGRVLFQKPSPYGTVLVNEDKMMVVHNEIMCYQGLPDHREIVNSALKITNDTKRALLIGFGCGIMVEEFLLRNNDSIIDVVEINPVVVDAQKLFYSNESNPIYNNRTRLIIEDGFKYLLDNEDKYDLIFVDLSSPIAVESSHLFTTEFSELLYENLNDHGTVAWWNFQTPESYEIVQYNTVRYAFDYVIRKELSYSTVYYAFKIPKFLPLNENEARKMTRYELNEDKYVNSIKKPVIVR